MILTAAAVGAASPARTQPPGGLRLLDVPYLPQSEALCGGAAIAMVMRFFGATNIYAETFSSLVDPDAAGIRGEDLVTALRTRSWTAESFRGDPAFVQSHLAAGRPIVALILDRPGRFHYVVVVGWAGGRVILHDPARAPFRLIDERAFTAAWSASDFWTLVATPPVGAAPEAGVSTPAPAPAAAGAVPKVIRLPCAPMIEEGVRLAGMGDRTEEPDYSKSRPRRARHLPIRGGSSRASTRSEVNGGRRHATPGVRSPPTHPIRCPPAFLPRRFSSRGTPMPRSMHGTAWANPPSISSM